MAMFNSINSYVSLPEGTQPKTQVSTIRKHGEKNDNMCRFQGLYSTIYPKMLAMS